MYKYCGEKLDFNHSWELRVNCFAIRKVPTLRKGERKMADYVMKDTALIFLMSLQEISNLPMRSTLRLTGNMALKWRMELGMGLLVRL